MGALVRDQELFFAVLELYIYSDGTIGIIYYTSDIVIGTGSVYCARNRSGLLSDLVCHRRRLPP